MSNTQNDKRVTYVDKSLVIVVKNPNGVRLVNERQNDRTDQRLHQSHPQTQVQLHSGESRLAAGIDIAEVIHLARPSFLAA
jgi:hypothetical protein